MILIFVIILITSVSLLASVFTLPLLISFIRSIFLNDIKPTPSQFNKFSIIVPAYNEEKSIAIKIETLFNALSRVDCEVEVIIGSDGSTDRTAEIASAMLKKINRPEWRLLVYENEGKCRTLNKLAASASGDIIISTDADIPLPENSIELVVQAFRSNSRLGCLSCIPCFKGLDIGSQKSYWSIEDRIRRAESDLGKLIVVTGMLYAYRKELFKEIPEGVMADDLWIPLNVLLKGYECRQESELLIPYEKTDEETEILRRKRVITGGMDVVRRLMPELVKAPFLLCLVFFHKINRWALPVWCVLILIATIGIWPWFVLVYASLALLGVAVLGFKRLSKLVYAAISPVLSFLEIMRKKDFARWEHTRKH